MIFRPFFTSLGRQFCNFLDSFFNFGHFWTSASCFYLFALLLTSNCVWLCGQFHQLIRSKNQHAKYEVASRFGMPTHSQFVRTKFVLQAGIRSLCCGPLVITYLFWKFEVLRAWASASRSLCSSWSRRGFLSIIVHFIWLPPKNNVKASENRRSQVT